jgi:hypothetical protein
MLVLTMLYLTSDLAVLIFASLPSRSLRRFASNAFAFA